MSYRVRVQRSEAAANGDLNLDCFIESDAEVEGETVWTVVPLGHRTLVLNGAAVLAITGGAGTSTQKRQALQALFKQEAESWGIDEADQAQQGLAALVEFPVNVNLE